MSIENNEGCKIAKNVFGNSVDSKLELESLFAFV